jgi:hypothetical protein
MPRKKNPKPNISANAKQRSWFERNPKKTLIGFLFAVFLLLDLVAGLLFIPADYHSFRRSHPVYHHGFYPHMNTSTKWGDRVYPLVTNSLGFIDSAPREVPLRSDEKRILLLGDSFTEGVGVGYEETFAGRLQALLRNQHIEFLNAGAVSYSPKLYYLKTQYLIEQQGLKFDELIVLIDISDIQDEMLYQSFKPGEENFVADLSEKVRKKLSRASYLYFSLSGMFKQAPPQHNVSGEDKDKQWADIHVWKAQLNPKLMENIGYYKTRGMWTIDASVFRKWGERGLELATENMSRLVALCNSNHIKLTLVVYPWPEQIFSHDLNSIQVSHWETFAADHQAGFLNLFPLFITGEEPRAVYDKFFIPGDEHWNAAGHALVADALYRYIEKTGNGLVPG